MKNNNNNMQNAEVKYAKLGYILDLLITSILALLLLASYARGGEEELIKHLNSPNLPYAQYMQEGWSNVDIKAKLPEFIDYSHKPDTILPALEKIADNPVGKLTLCLLYQARHNMPKERLKIRIKRHISKSGRHKTCFNPRKFKIWLNLEEIKNVDTVQYLNGNISRRKDTLDTALFHELNHALHCATGDLKDKNTAILDYVYGFDEIKFWWTEREKPNDEELYNIVGAFLRDGKLHHNPISCNMYDAFNSYRNGKN